MAKRTAHFGKYQCVIKFSGEPDVLVMVKTLKGRTYNPALRSWTVPLSNITDKEKALLETFGFTLSYGDDNNIRR